MKNFFNEFKKFAMRGNVIDLAVGVVIGTAFGKIVSSLVADVITPVIGFLVGGVKFTNLKFRMESSLAEGGAVTINYGQFLQTIFDFTIVAFFIFLFIKLINNLTNPKNAPPAAKPADVQLLEEIRDLLKEKKDI